MQSKLKDFFTAEFVKFFICSALAAGVNFTSRVLLSQYVKYAIAVFLAYICGILTAFTLNKFFVFNRRKGKVSRQFSVFVIVNLLGLVQTMCFTLLFRNVIFTKTGLSFYPDEIAHLIGIGAPMFVSFFGHKYFSFSETKK
jgi:putative flippase GtrA